MIRHSRALSFSYIVVLGLIPVRSSEVNGECICTSAMALMSNTISLSWRRCGEGHFGVSVAAARGLGGCSPGRRCRSNSHCRPPNLSFIYRWKGTRIVTFSAAVWGHRVASLHGFDAWRKELKEACMRFKGTRQLPICVAFNGWKQRTRRASAVCALDLLLAAPRRHHSTAWHRRRNLGGLHSCSLPSRAGALVVMALGCSQGECFVRLHATCHSQRDARLRGAALDAR